MNASPSGRARGGLVRAARMSPHERSDIARTAATERWRRAGIAPLPPAQATPELPGAMARAIALALRAQGLGHLPDWARQVPPELVDNLYRLRGWSVDHAPRGAATSLARVVGDLVYARTGAALAAALAQYAHPRWQTSWTRPPESQVRLALALHMESVLTVQRLALADGWSWARFVRAVHLALGEPQAASQWPPNPAGPPPSAATMPATRDPAVPAGDHDKPART